MIGSAVSDVIEWDRETLEELVGMELTPSRLKCAELALVAFRQAIEDHSSRRSRRTCPGVSPTSRTAVPRSDSQSI